MKKVLEDFHEGRTSSNRSVNIIHSEWLLRKRAYLLLYQTMHYQIRSAYATGEHKKFYFLSSNIESENTLFYVT